MAIRVLVVDDDRLQVELLTDLLRAAEFYVETAANGLAALQKVRVGWFDVVILDYQMPEVDGFAAACLITDFLAEAGRPRLIALSATPDSLRDRAQGVPLLFDAIEAKPWDPRALLATIRRCHARGPAVPYRWSVDARGLVAQTRPDPDATQAEPVRILVVEDDALLLSLLQSGLASEGYAVDTAANGLQALRRIAVARYDLVITDYQMPDIDGFTVGRLIFDLVSCKERPLLIALTSQPGRLSARDRGAFSVFDETIPKSAGIAAVLAKIRLWTDYKRTAHPVAPMQVMQLASRLGFVWD